MNEKHYNIGEIYRRGLLLNAEGRPYKDKATVSNVLKGKPCIEKLTKFGLAKYYTQSVIDELNARWNRLA